MSLVLLLFIAISIRHCHGKTKGENEDSETYFSRFAADLWLEGADVIKIIWRDCSKKLVDVKDVIDHKEYFPKFLRCMKRKTLRALDRSLSPDVVPIAEGVNLVRFEMVDRSGNVMNGNETSSWSDKELDEGEWRTLALQRMAKVLRTHVVKFDFDDKTSVGKGEYRGRQRRMMTMMMFGVVSIGMVIIPMGFQFLAVLGGKALLLAKMALILASIQGLKKVDLPQYDYPHPGFHERGKIATSPLNYGFYHQHYPPPPFDHPHFDKRSHDDDDWPTARIMPATPPPSMSIHSWPHFEGDIKVDRIHVAEEDFKKRSLQNVPEVSAVKSNARLYPVYVSSETSAPIFTSLDAPTPLTDLTTRPGEVQADFAMELPYNGFRFQTPTTVVSA
ncbi:hypothetical protein NE865_03588 [Phthorimaea operculella]|nr:hypothetical protein NE865_03588 [Phthorimaea operculella]